MVPKKFSSLKNDCTKAIVGKPPVDTNNFSVLTGTAHKAAMVAWTVDVEAYMTRLKSMKALRSFVSTSSKKKKKKLSGAARRKMEKHEQAKQAALGELC